MAAHDLSMKCLGVEAEEVEEQDEDVEGEVDAMMELDVKAEENKAAHQQSHYHHRETPCQGLKNRVKGILAMCPGISGIVPENVDMSRSPGKTGNCPGSSLTFKLNLITD